VLKTLEQDTSTSHIPVIMLKGSSIANETKLRKAGAAVYIEKSSLDFGKNADVLVRAVASFLNAGEILVPPGQQSPSTGDSETAVSEPRLGSPGGTA